MILHGYWRSSCTWRVRIALALKGVAHTQRAVHLTRGGGEQHGEAHQRRNPLGQVPVLELDDGRALSQSMAILDYLEARYPTPALLPADAFDRARALQLAEMVNAGIQPLQNLSVLRHLATAQGPEPKAWAAHHITLGLDALEAVARDLPGPLLLGDRPTYADLCLVPQLYNARRFGCDLARWPRLVGAEQAALALPAFLDTHPDRQPDAVAA